MSRPAPRAWIVAAGVLAGAAAARAQAPAPTTVTAIDACAAEADALRAHLVAADRATSRWNLTWTLAFGGAAAGQVALAAAEINPLGAFNAKSEDTLWVGAAKAGLGFASRLVMPLGVDLPPAASGGPGGARCAERDALRRSLARVAIKERRLFWMTHLGGLAVNLAGALVLWDRHDLGAGALSIAIGYPVGLLSAYTLPRASWHRWRRDRATWTESLAVSVTLTPGGDGGGLVVGGAW